MLCSASIHVDSIATLRKARELRLQVQGASKKQSSSVKK